MALQKIIFLDIDGVLNRAGTKERYHGMIGIEKKLLKKLLKLLDETGAELVLSSTWRLSDDWTVRMARYGVPVRMRTPYQRGAIRGEEVDEWLRLHPETESYVIIDDDRDFLPHQFLFKTDWENGLTDEICRKVRQHFIHRA